MNTDSQIRAVLDEVAEATRAKDIDALMRHYDRDVIAFDVIDPLQYAGADALRRRGATWFSSFQDAINYELRDVRITASGNAAFCYWPESRRRRDQ